MRKAQWILLTALGLTAGVFSALVLGGPVEAMVGMILVTPVLTGMVGLVLGASQWLHMRRVLRGMGGWWVALTCLGLGLGLAAGVVLVEQVGRAALALAAGFPASSLLVDLAIGGLKSPAGLLIFLLGSGAVLGASTAQRLRSAG